MGIRELAVRVPVLIVGGGPVGLAMAIGLRHFGVECVLVEGHDSASDFPKGRAVNVRSLEIFDQWGLAERVRAESMAEDPEAFGFLGETLLSAEFHRIPLAESVVTSWSPHQRVLCPQERVERVLRAAADERGADVRFGHRCVSLDDRGDVVVAKVERRGSASSFKIVADYVVAADGSRSPTREGLGIGFEGPGVLAESASILVDAPLGDRIADRTSVLYGVQRPRPGAGFAVVDNDHRWLLMMPRDVATEPVEWSTRAGPVRCAPAFGPLDGQQRSRRAARLLRCCPPRGGRRAP